MLRCVLDVNPQKPTNSSLHMTEIRNQIEVFILTFFALDLQISFDSQYFFHGNQSQKAGQKGYFDTLL